jgi:hypothetical protein
MDATNWFVVRWGHFFWATFILAITNRFLSLLEGQEAKNQMDARKYSGDIEDHIFKIKGLNNLVGMPGWHEEPPSKDNFRKIYAEEFLMLSTILDDEWIQMVIKASTIDKSFLVKERLLWGN